MREINGYVFIVDFKESELIFGRNTQKSKRLYEILEDNGIKPYKTPRKAIMGGQNFRYRLTHTAERKMDIDKRIEAYEKTLDVKIAKICMKISEIPKELDSLKNEEPLIVIKKEDGWDKTEKLYGEPSEWKSPYKNGAPLCYNQLQPYLSKNEKSAFERASELVKEMRERAKFPSKLTINIASFNLELL